MTAAVHAHDAIVRAAIERHGGYVFAHGVATDSAPRSRPQWTPVAAAVEAQRELGVAERDPVRRPDGDPYRRGDRSRRELLRRRREPCRAADGARPRRAGACCPTPLRSCSAAEPRSGHWESTCCAAIARQDPGVSGDGRRARRGRSRCCAASTTFRGQPAPSGQPPWSGATPRSTPSSNWCAAAAGHADRRRRGRQDPLGHRGRRRTRRRVRGRGLDRRTGGDR